MKKTTFLISTITLLLTSINLRAQQPDLVINGSFENTHGHLNGPGTFKSVDNVSSSNQTTIDLYSKNSCGTDYDVPQNYMGMQDSKTGNNYAGFIAYYADDAGIFTTKPGYRKYSEYIQFTFTSPLVAGTAYNLSYHISLAEKSAYAVSGIGVFFSNTKTDVHNNAFLPHAPHSICSDILDNNDWSTITTTYIASGGEMYLTLGCFTDYLHARKVIAPNTMDGRKAYYYIDDVSLAPQTIAPKDLVAILTGSCYQLSDLNFETDKSIILAESFVELNALTNFLKTYPAILVYIDGHTDKSGTHEHNDILSLERANSVKVDLVKGGISATRLNVRGYGETLPVDIQNENSLLNRRVEITICANVSN